MKTVIEMARDTGDIIYDGRGRVDIIFDEHGLERFAALVLAERENRQWRDLTDDEIYEAVDAINKWREPTVAARAVIAKFKEKQL